MPATRDELGSAVKEAIMTVLGRHLGEIGERTRPLQDLGMVSADGIDLALELEDRLDVRLPHEFNPLVDDEGRRGRSVGELVAWLEQHCARTADLVPRE